MESKPTNLRNDFIVAVTKDYQIGHTLQIRLLGKYNCTWYLYSNLVFHFVLTLFTPGH